MKKLFLIFLLYGGVAWAQKTATVTWSPSPDAQANPSITYNVYKATVPCATATNFTKVDSTAAGVLSFTDPTAVPLGQTVAYEITSVFNALEGPASNCVQAVSLPSPPVANSVSLK